MLEYGNMLLPLPLEEYRTISYRSKLCDEERPPYGVHLTEDERKHQGRRKQHADLAEEGHHHAVYALAKRLEGV